MTVGSVELSVSLSLAQLIKDAQKASDVIKQQIKQPEVKVKVSVETSSIVKLSKTLGGTVGAAQQFSNALGLTATQAQAAVTRIGQLNAAGATTAEKYKILKAEFGLTATQMYQLGNAAKLVDGNLRSQAATIQNNSKNVAGLANALGTSYGAAQRFAQGLGLTAKEANEAVSKLAQLNQVGATTAQKFQVLNQELGITKSQFDQINKSSGQTTDGLTAIAAGAGAIAAGIGGAFVKGTQEFLEFDNALRQSGVISGSLGNAQFDALRTEVERLGIATTKTPAQIAQMSISLSRAGFSAEQTKVALAGIVQASEATGESLETVGDIISKTLRAFGKDVSETQEVADLLVQTANSTNTSISGLGESLVYAGTVAKASNQPLDDILIVLGLLGDAGIQGGKAGRNLATALDRLKIASAGSETEFTGLVRGSKKMSEAFDIVSASARNSDGSMKSILEILPDLKSGLGNLAQVDQDVVTKALFGVEGGLAVTALLNATPARIAEVTSEVKNFQGASAKASAELTQGLGGSINLFTGSISAAAAELGKFVAIGLEPVVRAATGLLNAFLLLPAPIKGAILATTALTGAIAAAVAIIATYKLLNIQLVATQVAETAATILNTIAKTGAASAQLLFNTQLSLANARLTGNAAKLAIATLAQSAFGKSAKAAALGLGSLLLTLGLVTIAMASVQIAVSRFDDGGKGFKESAGEIEKSLLDLQLEMGKTKEAAEGILPKEPPPTDFIDGLVTKFNEVNSTINKLTGLPPDFLEVPTNAQKRLEDARLGVSELQQAMGNAIDASRSFSGSQEDAAKVSELLSAAITKAKEDLANLSPEKLGTVAYEELSGKINGTIKELETEQTALVKRTGIAKESSDASVDAGDAIAAAEKKAADAITATTEAYTQRSTELSNADKLREAEIKTSVALGLTTEADGQSQLLEQQRSSGQERLVLAENQATQLRDLLSSTTDPEQIKELNSQILSADSAVADARLAIAENLASAREAIERKALDAIEKANREAEAAIASSQNDRIIAIKQSQLEGSKSADNAAKDIAAIEQEGIGQTIALRRDELSQIQGLRQQGILSAEDAATREIELNGEIGSLNLARIEKEIAAQEAARAAALKADEERKKAALEAIDQSFAPSQAQREDRSSNLELQQNAIGQQNSLLSAQQNLQTALAGAENARYDRAIEAASRDGDSVRVEQLKLQQIQKQGTFLQQQFQIQLQQLALQQQQRAIELERQQIAAEIAKVEAEIAIQKALVNGATEAEITSLQRVLALQEKRLEQAGEAITQQSQINALESQTLNTTQKTQQQQQDGAVLDQRGAIADARETKTKVEDVAKDSTESTSSGRVLTSRGIQTLSADQSEKQRIASGQRTGFNARGLTTSSVATQLKTKVPSLQIADMGSGLDLSSTIQTGDAAVVAKIDELKVAVMQLANTPRCVSVSAPDPVAAVGQVLSDIGTANFRRAKL